MKKEGLRIEIGIKKKEKDKRVTERREVEKGWIEQKED